MTQPGPEAQIAVRELERFRRLHLYADRVLIRQGAYVEAARQLCRRAQRARWAGFAGFTWGAYQAVKMSIEYGRSRDEIGLFLGIFFLLAGAFMLVNGTHVHARTQELARHVDTLVSISGGRP